MQWISTRRASMVTHIHSACTNSCDGTPSMHTGQTAPPSCVPIPVPKQSTLLPVLLVGPRRSLSRPALAGPSASAAGAPRLLPHRWLLCSVASLQGTHVCGVGATLLLAFRTLDIRLPPLLPPGIEPGLCTPRRDAPWLCLWAEVGTLSPIPSQVPHPVVAPQVAELAARSQHYGL